MKYTGWYKNYFTAHGEAGEAVATAPGEYQGTTRGEFARPDLYERELVVRYKPGTVLLYCMDI